MSPSVSASVAEMLRLVGEGERLQSQALANIKNIGTAEHLQTLEYYAAAMTQRVDKLTRAARDDSPALTEATIELLQCVIEFMRFCVAA